MILTIVATVWERHAPPSQLCVVMTILGACLSETAASIIKIILS